jgi:hypothetical protein
MSIPTKADVIRALLHFADELRELTELYSRNAAGHAGLEEVRHVARLAEEVAHRLGATDQQYVHPETAQILADLADKVRSIADSSPDETYATSVRIPAVALKTFVFGHTPLVSTEGLRFSK